ncbi:MAG: carbohydrate ABC transporter permease, partial [Lachnospiraceae bacterium]|nr:carbohydrate ABC transporter permease [Lachnospiraceae bacterium]
YYNIQNILTNMLNNIQFLKSSAQLQGVNIELGAIPSGGIRMAVAVIAIIPVLIVYPFIQKSFVKGIVIGGVKG